MRLGMLKRRLTLQAAELIPDGAGGYRSSWSTTENLWGKITPVDKNAATQAERRITHIVRIRYASDLEVKTGMRLTGNNRTYVIHGIVEVDDGKRWMDVHVEEGGLLE